MRTFIQLGLMMALKPAQIALELSRSTSTITRELQRNGWISLEAEGGLRTVVVTSLWPLRTETNYQQTPWENTSLSGDFYFKVSK